MSEQRAGTASRRGEMNPARRHGDERAAAASRDEATRQFEVRRFFDLLIVTAMITMLIDVIASISSGSLRWFAPVIVGGLFGAWLAVGPRRAIDHGDVIAIVSRVAIVVIAWILVVALFQPFLALALVPAYLVPVAMVLPYLEGRRLRLVMGVAWVAAIASMWSSLLPDDAAPAVVETIVRGGGPRHGDRGRLHRPEPGGRGPQGLGSRVPPAVPAVIGPRRVDRSRGARPACRAAPRRGDRVRRLRHPRARSQTPGGLPRSGRIPSSVRCETAPESIAARPMLERVASDQAPVVIDVSDEQADPLERDRLRALGRTTMLLLPLTAGSARSGSPS